MINYNSIKKFLPESYCKNSHEAQISLNNTYESLLCHKKIPLDPWLDAIIEEFIRSLSLLDSNNYINSCPIGERESRIYCTIIKKRHFHLGHGMGRSGDLNEIQPKAAGSSIISKLANNLVTDAFSIAGLKNVNHTLIVPMATGMTLTLCFLTLRRLRPQGKYIIFSRIDQKSCFKSILAAGFSPVIVDPLLVGDELKTNMAAIAEAITNCSGSDQVAAILSTTSCFAPRGCDDLKGIAALCSQHDIPHVVNNAYGMNSLAIVKIINKAINSGGRIDCIVQSCDKNFMVPVGGAIIADFKSSNSKTRKKSEEKNYKVESSFCDQVAATYPGRASLTPSLDVLITLLSVGAKGYKGWLLDQSEMYTLLKEKMSSLALNQGECLLETPNNPISLAMTLTTFGDEAKLTEIGSMLFTRRVTGARVVVPGEIKHIDNNEFIGWGSHHPSYPHAYLTMAAAIGLTTSNIEGFVDKLRGVLIDFRKKYCS